MLNLSMLFSIAALAVAVGLGLFLRSRGAFAGQIITNPPVELPVVVLTHRMSRDPKCSNKEFRGSVEVDLIYVDPAKPNASVRLTLEVKRRNNCSADLATTNLGIFRNDVVQRVDFSGELTKPCEDADFTVVLTVVNQGPGSTTLVDTTKVEIDALPFTVAMPTTTSTTNGKDFNFDITITCCDAGARHRIIFTNESDVHGLDADPNGFTCNRKNDIDTIAIKGKKDDINTVGSFTVKAETATGDCVLGSVLVE